MKNLKKWLPICLIMLACTCLFGMPVQASNKVRINKTKATVTAGSILKLNMVGTNRKVKWSTDNYYVAAVKNGNVYAREPGRATIKAKIGNKIYTCKVNVRKYKDTLRKMISYMETKGNVKGYTSDRYMSLKAPFTYFGATDAFICDDFALLEYNGNVMDTWYSFEIVDYVKRHKKFVMNGSTIMLAPAVKNNVVLLIANDSKNSKKIIKDFKKFK